MKKIIKFFVITLIVIGSLSLNNCSSNEEIRIPPEIKGELKIVKNGSSLKTNKESGLSFTFEVDNTNQIIRFESSIENNTLNSILRINYGDSKWVEVTNFNINFKDKRYKEKINLTIQEKANFLIKEYDYDKIREIENIIDIIPELLFKKLNRDKYYEEPTLAIFYHLSVLKSAKRAYEINSKNCNCGIYDSSLNDRTPFFCAEDKLVSVDEAYDFITKISNKKEFAGKKFNPVKTLSYLKTKSGKLLSASTINNILRQEFEYFWNNKLSKEDIRTKIFPSNYTLAKEASLVLTSNAESGGFPIDPYCLLYGVTQGSDCGCCLNYSGPCFYCTLACYLHDLSCEDCDFWCGPLCVPGPC